MTEKPVALPAKDQFAEQLDSIFRTSLDDGRVIDLHLFKLETTISNSIQEGFSLLFRAPVDAPPFQNMFHMEHDTLGAMDLFLVPVKKKEDGLIYEAVFNRMVV